MKKISAAEAKALTGAANKFQAFQALYAQLENRKWSAFGREYRPMGMEYLKPRKPQYLALSYIASDNNGGAYWDVKRILLSDAVDCVSGNFEACQFVYA